MKTGALLDNLHQPADSSFRKLAAMRASCVGTLWTAGTKHRRAVYDECERRLSQPEYIVRIGGHKQTPDEWLADARAALAEVPPGALGRTVLVCGNEPNHPVEGWSGNPEGYGHLYRAICDKLSLPVLFAGPSLGLSDWGGYFLDSWKAAGEPRRGIANLYAENVHNQTFAGFFSDLLYVGEVNMIRPDRVAWFHGEAWPALQQMGVRAALVFIVGGRSGGAWDERYIITEQEAAGLAYAGPPGEATMDEATQEAKIDQILRQNAAITAALIAILKGNLWQGAESVAGQVIALTGKSLAELGLTPPLA